MQTGIDECTLGTCPLSYGTVHYDPSLIGNALYLAIFAFLLLVQTAQLWKYRTWSFSCSMLSGLILEIIGYLGRVQMHFNPFAANPFLLYIICITIAPVFFSAAIYIILSRIIVQYGPQYSRFSPKTVSLTFMTFDFIALILQAVGGAIADTAANERDSAIGTHIMVAGLAFQAFSLLIFIIVASEFAIKIKGIRRLERNIGSVPEGEKLNGRSERSFKLFLLALTISTVFILTRSAFRVAELAKGFDGKLANDEVSYMVLEGGMIIVATCTLTVFHPGPTFGVRWKDAGWTWRRHKFVDTEAIGGENSNSRPENWSE